MNAANRLSEVSLESIQALVAESRHAFLPGKDTPNETIDEVLAWFKMHDPTFKVFSYTEQREPISYITALGTKAPAMVAIGPMYVAKAHRGKGIGKRQVQHFIAWAVAEGYSEVFTKTWATNKTSKAIFESLGFIIEKTIPYDRANGDATIYLRLNLNEHK